MPDLVAVQGLISGLQGAVNITKGFLQLKTMAEVQAKVIELQGVIMATQSSALEAQAEHAALLQRIRDLEQQIAAMETWENQKSRYKLTNAWPGTPILVYKLKQSRSDGEPPHWICTKCYDEGRRSFLNPHRDAKNFILLACPTCKATIHTEWRGIGAPDFSPE